MSEMKLFVSTHNDDAGLFGAFTLQRETPLVLTVFDSFIQVRRGHARCDAETRRNEDRCAVKILGCEVLFGGVPDDKDVADPIPDMVRSVLTNVGEVSEAWIPAVEPNGHNQHNLVGQIGLEVFAGVRVHRYLSYTRTGGKSTGGKPAQANGAMVLKKLQALACYRTQIEIDALGCWPHFMRDMTEYYA